MEIFRVNTTNDVINPNDGVLSLREAIIAANATAAEDTIDISSITGTIVLNSALPTIIEDLNIIGNGSQNINGNNLHSIFSVDGILRTDVTISNLTVANGRARGGDGFRGGGGKDIFALSIGGGNDRITDFKDGIDKIKLLGSSLNFDSILIRNRFDQTVILSNLNNEVSVLATLDDVKANSLTSNDFI